MNNVMRTAVVSFWFLERKGGYGLACNWLREFVVFLWKLRKFRSGPEYTLAS